MSREHEAYQIKRHNLAICVVLACLFNFTQKAETPDFHNSRPLVAVGDRHPLQIGVWCLLSCSFVKWAAQQMYSRVTNETQSRPCRKTTRVTTTTTSKPRPFGWFLTLIDEKAQTDKSKPEVNTSAGPKLGLYLCLRELRTLTLYSHPCPISFSMFATYNLFVFYIRIPVC